MAHFHPTAKDARSTSLRGLSRSQDRNNILKGNKTPAEAGLELIRLPEVPKRRKGDMVIMTFTFNPNSEAHRALVEMGIG